MYIILKHKFTINYILNVIDENFLDFNENLKWFSHD